MKLDLTRLFGDAWALFRRDRALLLGLAGPFYFLPRLALLMFVPTPVLPVGEIKPDSPEAAAAVAAVMTTGGSLLLTAALGALATLAVMVLYLDRDQPDVGAALARGGRLWPRFALVNLIAAPPVAAGLLLFYLPGLYVMARLMLAGPALVAERPLAAGSAIGRGWRLSRGAALPLTAALAATLGLGWLGSSPLLRLADWLDKQPGGGNPVAVVTVDALAAGVATAAMLAAALIAVVAYRRLASSGI